MIIELYHICVTNEPGKVILMRLYLQKHRRRQYLHKNEIVLINIIAYKSILCLYIITFLRLQHEQVN